MQKPECRRTTELKRRMNHRKVMDFYHLTDKLKVFGLIVGGGMAYFGVWVLRNGSGAALLFGALFLWAGLSKFFDSLKPHPNDPRFKKKQSWRERHGPGCCCTACKVESLCDTIEGK